MIVCLVIFRKYKYIVLRQVILSLTGELSNRIFIGYRHVYTDFTVFVDECLPKDNTTLYVCLTNNHVYNNTIYTGD
jgi:hypothetical protein